MMKLNGLAQLAIDAAGGLDRWCQFATASARLLNGGVLWPLKHQQGVLDDVHVRVRPAERVGISLAVWCAQSAYIIF